MTRLSTCVAQREAVGGSAFRSHGSVQGWQSRLPQLRTWNTAETASRSLASVFCCALELKRFACCQATSLSAAAHLLIGHPQLRNVGTGGPGGWPGKFSRRASEPGMTPQVGHHTGTLLLASHRRTGRRRQANRVVGFVLPQPLPANDFTHHLRPASPAA